MLPKLKINERLIQKDTIVANAVHQDSIRGMIYKSKNLSYKLMKEHDCPKSPESPWGDFPPGVVTR